MRTPSTLLTFAVLLGSCGANRTPATRPSWAETSTRTDVLKTGAAVLQSNAPLAASIW